MSAKVIAYSAHPEDSRLTLKWECLTCGVEGGWMTDRAGAAELVEALAAQHNAECHPEASA